MLIQLLLKQIFALMGYVTNTNSFPKQLSSKEEEKLLEMYKNGDESAKNKLIEHNLRLVAHIAKKYTGIFKDGDDAVSIGTIGLIKGISSYNFDKKTKLSTYISRCIENEILMYLRKNSNRRTEVSIDEPLNIDWDGIVHHGAPGGVKDTKNEIDVMLMHGLTPVFVSCKNGAIKEIELYKLNTVAERFGGEFAKKLLVSTDFDPENEDTRKAFLQRAADMNIVVI